MADEAAPERGVGTLWIERGGERLALLAERALYWPARRRLLIADLHLGKADTFRRAGLALPAGSTERDLQRLSALIERTEASSLWVLGDLLHGEPQGQAWWAAWRAWRQRHARLAVAVLPGNHDRALAPVADRLQIDRQDACVLDGTLLLTHDPEDVGLIALDGKPAAAGRALHRVCGHLHPAMTLPGLPGRWPAFWLRERMTILPAFTRLTEGLSFRLGRGEAAAVCVRDRLVCVAPGGNVRPPITT